VADVGWVTSLDALAGVPTSMTMQGGYGLGPVFKVAKFPRVATPGDRRIGKKRLDNSADRRRIEYRDSSCICDAERNKKVD